MLAAMAVSRCTCRMLQDPPYFYYPYLTSLDMVIEVMKPYLHINGAFLIRNSITKSGVLTVSAVHERGIKHFHVLQVAQCSGIEYILDRQFKTLQDLVQFYSQHDVPNMEGIAGVRLTFPIFCKKYCEQPAIPNNSTENVSLYYSKVRDVNHELSSDLMAHLSQQDKEDHGASGKCVCGLYLVDSELPCDWSMHISTECGTEGQLFFTSPTNETSWELPPTVLEQLNTEQWNRIRQLMIDGRHRATWHSSGGEKRISVE